MSSRIIRQLRFSFLPPEVDNGQQFGRACYGLAMATTLFLATSPFVRADSTVSTDTTPPVGSYSVSPAGALIISSTSNPLLTLSGITGTSGVEAVVVGNTTGQQGRLLVNGGSVLTNSGDLSSLGVYGSTIVESGIAYLGLNAGSTGTATVSGGGSQWNSANGLHVGAYGTGTLSVEAGGVVSTDSFDIIGGSPGSQGTATVTGAGSQWNETGVLVVGYSGTGTLNVQAGGVVSTDQGSIIGRTAGPLSQATVSGAGSQWNTTNGYLTVGANGSATLNVNQGGIVSDQNGNVASDFGSQGQVTVSGAGSQWNSSSSLSVGGTYYFGAPGTLTVADSGSVNVGGSTTVWYAGTLNLAGGTLNTGSFDASVGTFNFTGGGTLHVTGATTLAPGATLAVGAGSTYLNDGSITAPVSATAGGVVGGSGNFADLTIGPGGVASPGHSPGSMSDTSTAWAGGGDYLWQINALATGGGTAGSNPGWDLWNVGALSVTATHATPFVIAVNSLDDLDADGALTGWNPNLAQSWLIAQAGVDGTFTALLELLSIDDTQFASFNSLGLGHFFLSVGNNGRDLLLEFNPASVPEPSSYALAVMGLAGLILWRRHIR